MPRKYAALITLLTFCSHTIFSQMLSRGDEFPEVVSDQTINFPKGTFKLSDFRGMPVIIDYWSFQCASCLRAFPETEALQKKMHGKAQIILVNMESREATLQRFEKFKTLKSKVRIPDVPMVTGDTIFKKLVPVRSLPMLLWITADGKLAHITSSINEKQLMQFVNKEVPEMMEKTPKADFLARQPLFEQPNREYLKDITYYSYIAHWLDGTTIGNANKLKRNDGKSVRISNSYASIAELVMDAYSERQTRYRFYMDVNVVLEVKDRFRFIQPRKEDTLSVSRRIDWDQNHCWRYDCAVPAEQSDRIFEYMRQDVCRYFNLDVSIEKRKVRCLALVRTSDSPRLHQHTRFDPKFYMQQLKEKRLDSLYLLGTDMKKLVNMLSAHYNSTGVRLPLVDETNYKEKFNFIIPFNADGETTSQFWTEQLARYGLALVERDCVTDILVIRER